MRTFVDTSALFALLDEDDANHASAAGWLAGPGSDPNEILVTHSYVVVESAALAHRRLGHQAARILFDAFLPAMTVCFVDEHLHRTAAATYLAAAGRRVSFVDSVSFEMMRGEQLDRAFAFDADFSTEGFSLIPG